MFTHVICYNFFILYFVDCERKDSSAGLKLASPREQVIIIA